MKKVSEAFQVKFKIEPLLIFAPGRINLIGEHTDYNDGFAMPGAINKGIGVAVCKTDENFSHVVALDVNQAHQINLASVQPLPNGGWRNYVLGVIGETQKLGYQMGNFNLVFSGNIPDGSGMSSSAALENSIVFALNELFDLKLTKNQMILISQKAEHNYAGVNCGIMDQYASMFGLKNSALLLDCRTVTSETYEVDFKDYKLLLINTNVKHDLSESAYNNRRAVCEEVSGLLGIKALRDANIEQLKKLENQLTADDYQKAKYVIEENQRVLDFIKAAKAGEVETCGQLLYASHQGLSEQYKVSCEELDFLVDFTKKTSAVVGGRMMGGGFGGCTINLVHKAEVKSFGIAISEAYLKQFNRACSLYKVKLSDGTRVINL